MSIGTVVLVFVLVQRAAELMIAARNTARLRGLGAVEIDARGYPWFVVLHGGWLIALVFTLPGAGAPSWPLLGLFGLLQVARLWVIRSLDGRWTTRIIVLPGTPLVAAGPYRYVRHPNYLIVMVEIVVLPLAFGAAATALGFGVANLALLARRIAIEDRALRPA